MTEGLVEPPTQPTGFYDRAGNIFVIDGLRSLERADYALERLRSEWSRLLPSERRELYGKAKAALGSAENRARAIAAEQGDLLVEMENQIKEAAGAQAAGGNKASTKIRFLVEKERIIQSILMQAGALLEKKPQSSESLYIAFQAAIFVPSVPFYTDEERKTMTDDQIKDLIVEREFDILGYEPPDEDKKQEASDDTDLVPVS